MTGAFWMPTNLFQPSFEGRSVDIALISHVKRPWKGF